MDEKIFEIRAKEVTVEVTDIATGKVHRRTLPMDYFENASGERILTAAYLSWFSTLQEVCSV